MQFFSKHKMCILCFLFTAFALFFCSKNSFLYVRNDWSDENVYMTIARGMHDGKTLYRELFDHKGPILYFIYYLLAFLSKGYWPVYLLEVLSYGLFVYYSYKTIVLYVDTITVCKGLFFIVIISCVPVTMSGFFMGGSLEELSLCLFMIPIFWVLKAICLNTWVLWYQVVLCGVFCGLCFWTKYTFCGFFFGLCLFVVWRDFQYKCSLLRDVSLFLFGFLLWLIPVLIYCIDSKCLFDMIRIYFYDNLFAYPDSSVGVRFGVRLISNVCMFFVHHLIAFIALLLSFVYWLCDKRFSQARLLILLTFIGLFLSVIVFGVPFLYYGFVFNLYLFAGYLVCVRLVGHVDCFKSHVNVIMSVCVLLLCLNTVFFNKNIYYLDYNDGSSPQDVFGDIIIEAISDRRPFVLQYRSLDLGFMQVCNAIVPSPYSCCVNLRRKDAMIFQEQMIKNKVPDYIVTVGYDSYKKVSFCTSGYQLRKHIRSKCWYNQYADYYLYEKL